MYSGNWVGYSVGACTSCSHALERKRLNVIDYEKEMVCAHGHIG